MNENQDSEQREYEERLQRRLKILKEKFEQGKVHINPDLKVIDSLKAVRYAADGSIDLSTVDGLVRSLALAVQSLNDREEIKEALPLQEIQSTYFDFIERNFGQFFDVMRERGLSAHDAGLALSGSDESRTEISKIIPEFQETIAEFWDNAGYAAQAHVEDMHDKLRGIFGGDLFPSHSESIASKCGIYADTIILPDPFLRTENVSVMFSEERKVYQLVKNAMNILQYKDLTVDNIDQPIIAIIPDYSALDESEKKFYFELGRSDALFHAQKIFGRKFESIDEFREFAMPLETPEQVVSQLHDPHRILFETEWKNDPRVQLEKAVKGEYAELLDTPHAGLITLAQAVGRMSVSNELLIKAGRLHGAPIIDAPTSWQYFAWKLEYDAERIERDQDLTDLHILRGLQSQAENEMEWLGRVPHDALIEIRKKGALDEIRHILGKGVAELVAAKPTNFHRSADQIFDNIHEAFDDHKARLKKLQSKKWKFAGKDIGTWLAVGTLEIAAAATGMPVYGLSAIAANQLVDAPKLKDIPSSIRDLATESKQLRNSPVGMLFAYANG